MKFIQILNVEKQILNMIQEVESRRHYSENLPGRIEITQPYTLKMDLFHIILYVDSYVW